MKSGAIKPNIVCPKPLFWKNREKLFHFLIFDFDIKWWRFLDSIGCDTLNKSNLMLIPPKMCSYSINKNPKNWTCDVCTEKKTSEGMSKNRCFLREKHRMSIGHTIQFKFFRNIIYLQSFLNSKITAIKKYLGRAQKRKIENLDIQCLFLSPPVCISAKTL